MKKMGISTILAKIKLLAIVIAASFLVSAECWAAGNTIALKVDKNDLQAGDEITVSADLSGEDEVYAITATLQYDQNVFEPISDDNFTIAESESISYNAENNQFGIINQSGEIEDALFEVHLRVKDDANVGNTNIALTNIQSSDGNRKTEYSDVTTQVLVTRDVAEDEVLPQNQENVIAEGKTEEQNVFFTAPFVITALIMLGVIILVMILHFGNLTPHTSKLYYSLITIGVVISVLIVAITVINNSKEDVNGDGMVGYDDAEEIIDYLIDMRGGRTEGTDESQSGTESAGGAAASYQAPQSPRSSQSSQAAQAPNSGYNHDVNNDGKVDVNDAGHAAEDAKDETSVQFRDSELQSAYVEKESTRFVFGTEVKPKGVSIVEVKVKVGSDGEEKYYTVTPEGDDFAVQLDPFTTAGKTFVKITGVRTSNDVELGVNYQRNLEVLKARPGVAEFAHDTKTKQIKFKIFDVDGAFESGKAEIYNITDGTEEPIETVEITPDDKEEVTISAKELDDEKEYTLEVKASYCRSLDKNYECYDEATIYTRDIETLEDFKFELSGFSVSDYVKPSEKPLINFYSNNSKNLLVKSARVEIDGDTVEEVAVTLNNDGRYEATLDKANMNAGRHSVVLDSVTIEGDKTFQNRADFQATDGLSYFVPGTLPTVTGLELKNQAERHQINVIFRLNDDHSTVTKLAVVLQDSTGNTITREEIGREDSRFQQIHTSGVNLSYPADTKDRGFTVRVLADYDLGEKYNFTEQELAQADIMAYDEVKLWINEVKSKTTYDGKNMIYTQYAEKGNKKFWLELNTSKRTDPIFKTPADGVEYVEIGGYTINGNNYVPSSLNRAETEPTGQNNFDYTALVNVGIPDQAGVIDLEVSRVQFVRNQYYRQYNNWYAIPKVDYQIEVLRDAPRIENLVAEEDYANRKVTFRFDVVVDEAAQPDDESFQSGILKFGDLEQAFTARGSNTVVFEGDQVPLDETKELVFKATFDRDTDTLAPVTEDDNQYTDYAIYSSQYGLFNPEQYQDVKIENAEALTQDKDINDDIFEKNSPIGVYFEIANVPEQFNDPVKVRLDGYDEAFELVQVVDEEGNYLQNQYAVFLPGHSEAGKWSARISDIILKNGKIISLSDENSAPVDFEVLKDTPMITDFAYKKAGGEYEVKTTLNDPDGALIPELTTVIVTNDLGATVYQGKYNEEFSFEDDASTSYFVVVVGDYNRAYGKTSDQDNPYYHTQVDLLNAVISTEDKYIEIKDLSDINLYRFENNNIVLVDETSQAELNANIKQYFVALETGGMPTIRVPLKSAYVANGHLYLTLDSQYLSQEDDYKSHDAVTIDFGEVDAFGKAKNEFHPLIAFNKLLEDLQNNRDIELTRDYDASVVSNTNQSYYVESYQGEIKGNGHVIKNLASPLIGELRDGSKVEDVVFKNVSLSGGSAKGSLANTTGQVEISQVIIDGVTSSNSNGQTGGLVGALGRNSVVNVCGVTDLNLNVGSSQQNGGLVGFMGEGARISNSYAIGRIGGWWNFRGGLVGNVENYRTAYVDHSYAKVDLTDGGISCGIGCSWQGKLDVSNSVSLSSRFNNAPISNSYNTLTNNYFLKHDTVTYESIADQQTLVEDRADVDEQIFQQAGFDNSIWRLDAEVSYDMPPRLSFEKTSNSSLEGRDGYLPSNANIYSNLSILTPYYAADDIIKAGNRLQNGTLATKDIRLVNPIDAAGNLVTYLTTDDRDKIKKLIVVYTDGSSETYDVAYTNTYDALATYRIKQLRADYTFPHYVINANSRLMDNLVYYLRSLIYANNLDPLTAEADSRIVREFYGTTTKNELREFVLKYLSNSNYANTFDSAAIDSQIEREIKGSDQINRALYLYNFLRRFYAVKIGNINLYDYVMFNMQNFDSGLTMDGVINKFFSNTATNFNTAATNSAYKGMFASATGLENLPKFLEYLATHVGGVSDMNDWVRSQFKGILVEVSIDNLPDYDSDQGLIENTSAHYQNTGVLYTLWDHFSHADNNDENGYKAYNYILPLLTMPDNSTYIISMPVQFVIGSQRTYIADPNDPSLHERLDYRANVYAARYKKYFTTAYGLLGDKTLFNNMHIIQFDKTLSYNSDGVKSRQRFGSSEEDHFKNFNEVVGFSPAEQAVNAASWGPYVEWQVAGVMDSILTEYYAKYQDEGVIWDTGSNTFGTWSHETAHSIDARLWLRNKGRRFDSGAEDYADGFLRQEFSDKLINMNLSRNFGDDCGYGANCDPERIDTPGEVQDFYQKAFDVIYTIDYIEALAFLQLSSDDMSQVGIQISYPYATGEDFHSQGYENYTKYFPNGLADPEVVDAAGYRAYNYTRYRQIDAAKYDEMKADGGLDDIDDLYDNQLMIYPGIYQMSTRGSNSYGGEGLNVAHWYQPHNDYGRPDSYSLKWLSYEMMGRAGYDQGFLQYASNVNPISAEIYTSFGDSKNLDTQPVIGSTNSYKTDLLALQRVTGQNDVTFESYKKGRFAEIEKKLKNLNTIIDVKEYVRKFYNALVTDAEYARTHQSASGTNMTESTKLRVEIYQALKKHTDDFVTNDIYGNQYMQDFGSIEELRHLMAAQEVEDE